MKNDDVKQESEQEQKPQQSEEKSPEQKEQQLNEIKTQHKGRYPREVAKQAKALKQKRDGTIVKIDSMDRFLAEYFRNGGNATNAAMVVFNCKSRSVAANVGSHYLSKAKSLGRVIMEEEGATFARMVQMALIQMEKPKADGTFVALWDRLMKLGGYEDFMNKAGPAQNTVNVLNIQKELLKEYVQGEFVAEELPEEVLDVE